MVGQAGCLGIESKPVGTVELEELTSQPESHGHSGMTAHCDREARHPHFRQNVLIFLSRQVWQTLSRPSRIPWVFGISTRGALISNCQLCPRALFAPRAHFAGTRHMLEVLVTQDPPGGSHKNTPQVGPPEPRSTLALRVPNPATHAGCLLGEALCTAALPPLCHIPSV